MQEKIKFKPEDFIVEEIPGREFKERGDYLVLRLVKKNYNTEDAAQLISKKLNMPRKNIGYAGTKDRRAITKQLISIYKGSKERILGLELKDISLEFIGYSNAPVSLGDLEGNKFIITIRNVDKEKKIQGKEKIPNYYDEQRFSGSNARIGKHLIKKEFGEAAELLKEDYKYGETIMERLRESPNDYINAIKTIPRKIIQIYLHAYQSLIWNKTVEKYLEKEREQEEIPIVGFATEIESEEIKKIVEIIMLEENIAYRDFILREFREISLEGNTRPLYQEIKGLEIGRLEEDEEHPGKNKVTVKFILGKGSYATITVKELLKNA